MTLALKAPSVTALIIDYGSAD